MFKVNEYYEGKVKSLAFQSQEGKATIGVIAAGEYEFGTATIEIMTVTSGKMEVLLPDTTEWKTYNEFESFKVEKDKKFKVKVSSDTSYKCIYL